jgi:multiple sugar transport system substrate-binding protein
MKWKTNKKFLMLISILVLVLSACSSNNSEVNSNSESGGGTDKPYDGEELTVLYMSGTYADAAKLIVPEFEKKTGAKVTVVDAPYLQLFEKEFSSLVSGAGGYDVMSVAMQWDGQFLPHLEPIPEDSGIDFDKFIPAIADVTGIYNDVRIGVPMATDAYGIFYRKDIFEKEGIEANPHWTWEEYMQTAKQLTKNGMYGTTIAGQVDQMTGYTLPIFWSKGGHLFTKDWEPIPDKELMVDSIQYLLDLKKATMPEGIMSYDITTQVKAFVNGEFAMAEIWPSFGRGPASDPESSQITDTWGLLPFPSGGNSQISSWDLAIPKDSKNKELALEWIKMYTSEEKQRLFLEEIGIGPTISALYTDPEIVEKHPDFTNHLISLEGALPPLRFPGSQEYTDFLDKQISAALSGTVTPEEAVDNVINKWSELMSQYGKPEKQFSGDYRS